MENVYELIYMIKQNDEYAHMHMIEQHRYLLMKIISDFVTRFPFLYGHKDDILQETFISVFDSIEYYRDDQKTQFRTFLITCINRKIKTIVRQLLNQKNYVMCNSLSLDECIKEDGDLYGMDINASSDQLIEPGYHYRYNEAAKKFKECYDRLDKEDKIILNLAINKVKYQDAARILSCSYKTYDNRIQRIKRNIKKAIYA